jgi:hypothetical protein
VIVRVGVILTVGVGVGVIVGVGVGVVANSTNVILNVVFNEDVINILPLNILWPLNVFEPVIAYELGDTPPLSEFSGEFSPNTVLSINDCIPDNSLILISRGSTLKTTSDVPSYIPSCKPYPAVSLENEAFSCAFRVTIDSTPPALFFKKSLPSYVFNANSPNCN